MSDNRYFTLSTNVLRTKYGRENVLLSDIKKPDETTMKDGPYVYSDVTDSKYMHSIIVDNSIDWVVHYSALLSAAAEDNLQRALEVGPWKSFRPSDWRLLHCIFAGERSGLSDCIRCLPCS